MKVAIIGSRSLTITNLQDYIAENTVEIISDGAKGIDTCAENFALKHSLKYTECLPKYNLYDRSAPLKRNIEIILYADMVFAFWDGKSRDTKFVIDNCKRINNPIKIITEF